MKGGKVVKEREGVGVCFEEGFCKGKRSFELRVNRGEEVSSCIFEAKKRGWDVLLV